MVQIGNFFGYNYIGLMQNNKKPQYNHLFAETSYGLYFIDSTNDQVILKTANKGVTVSTVHTATYQIYALWYDGANERLYYIMGEDAIVGGNTIGAGYIDLTDDSHTAQGSISVGGIRLYAEDIFMIGANIYALLDYNGTHYYVYTVPAWGVAASVAKGLAGSFNYTSLVEIVGTDAYFVAPNMGAGGNTYLLKFTGAAIVTVKNLGVVRAVIQDRRTITYDGQDVFQFVVNITGTYTRVTYTISTDTYDETELFKIILMANRFADPLGTNDPPYSLEKGFHDTNYTAHQISKDITPPQVYKIADLTNHSTPPTDVFIAISDSFLITDDAQLYEYVNISSECDLLKTRYRSSIPSTAEFNSDRVIGNGQTIEIYDNHTGTNVLAFRGTAKLKKIRGGERTYECISYDKELLNTRFSKDYAGLALDSKEIMEDILDNYAHFHWYGLNIDANGDFTTTREPNFKNQTIAAAFDTLMDMEDGAWSWDADGEIYAWYITEIPVTQLITQEGIFQATQNFKNETVGSEPSDWTVVTGGTTAVLIIDELGTHKMILGIDNDGDADAQATASYNITKVANTVIEFYWRQNNAVGISNVTLNESSSAIVKLRMYANWIQYNDGQGWINVIGTIAVDTWYHISIRLNDTANTFDIYIDESLEGDDLEYFADSTTGVDGIVVSSNDDLYYSHIHEIKKWEPGIYRATYNFLNDANGSVPSGWTDGGLATPVEVIASLDGHTKVLQMYDETAGSVCYCYQSVSTETSGTVEFWVRANDITERTQVTLRGTGSTDFVYFYIVDGLFKYFNGAVRVQIPNVNNPQLNTWHHVIIHFECGAGGYQGLGADQCKFIIDGVDSGAINFSAVVDNITTVYLYCVVDGAGGPITSYFDAIGYSWDAGYTVGDNDPLSDFVRDQTNGQISIEESFDNHNNIIKMQDISAAGEMKNTCTFSGAQTYGTIEFWVAVNDYTKFWRIIIDNAGTPCIDIGHSATANVWQYYTGGAWNNVPNVSALVNNTFSHIVIHFELTAGGYQGLAQFKCEIIVDGVSSGALNLRSNQASVNNLYFSTNNASIIEIYVDALGFSWDADYAVGDNAYQDTITYFDAFGFTTMNKYVGEGQESAYLTGDNLIEEHIIVFKTETTNSGHLMDVPAIDEIMETLNKITLYGQIVNGARLKTGSGFGEDIPSQLAEGINEYVDFYSHIADQTEINTLSDDLLTRTGMINPMYITILLQNVGYQILFKSINLLFGPYLELESAADYFLQEYELDFKPENTTIRAILSTGLIQKGRQQNSDQKKTAKSDEEQIDVLGSEQATHEADDIAGDVHGIDTDFVSAQHYREAQPDYSYPENIVTAGANNCYYVLASPWTVTFGTTAYGNGFWLPVYRVPTDYIAGSNIILKWYWRMVGGAVTKTLNYRIYLYRITDGVDWSLEYDSGLLTQSKNVNSKWHTMSSAMTATNVVAGEQIILFVTMSESLGALVTNFAGGSCLFSVNGRD